MKTNRAEMPAAVQKRLCLLRELRACGVDLAYCAAFFNGGNTIRGAEVVDGLPSPTMTVLAQRL